MPKARGLEATLSELRTLRDNPTATASLKRLRAIIEKGVCHAVARAAEIVRDFEIHDLAGDLMATYPRFTTNALKSDKGCVAKTRIADALAQMGIDAETLYRQGVSYTQMEPVFGGKADTAVELRGLCALGMVRAGYPDAVLVLAELLNDKEAAARADAARALGFSGDERALPLLRFKALHGDTDARIINECLQGLLRLDPESSLPFVTRLLADPDPSRQEVATLALGESRLAEAFEPLKLLYESAPLPALGRTALIAMALLRRDEAFQYLLSILKDKGIREGKEALQALSIYRCDESIRRKVVAVLKTVGKKGWKQDLEDWNASR